MSVLSQVTPGSVLAGLEQVHQRIRRCGRDPAEIKVVAVTKGRDVACTRAALEAGLIDIGEDRIDALNAKAAAITGARWHFIGGMQRRSLRRLTAPVAVWQSVDRPEIVDVLGYLAPSSSLFVQINLTGEAQRHGCAWHEASPLVEHARRSGFEVCGLMGVGDQEHPRPGFRRLASLARELSLAEVSMGMSEDLEVAVEEGTTMLRIGTTLFGPRP